MRKPVCLLVCSLLASSVAHAQSDWKAVTALLPGTRLRIEATQKRGSAEGAPASRNEIGKVERLSAPKRAKYAKWGFAIGAVAGAIAGYTTAETNKGYWTFQQSAGWGAIGTLTGALSGPRERTLIYERP